LRKKGAVGPQIKESKLPRWEGPAKSDASQGGGCEQTSCEREDITRGKNQNERKLDWSYYEERVLMQRNQRRLQGKNHL